jgi:ribosomal protein L27
MAEKKSVGSAREGTDEQRVRLASEEATGTLEKHPTE